MKIHNESEGQDQLGKTIMVCPNSSTAFQFVYGYSMTVGPDVKPKVREFGNEKSLLRGRGFFRTTPEISS